MAGAGIVSTRSAFVVAVAGDFAAQPSTRKKRNAERRIAQPPSDGASAYHSRRVRSARISLT